jgi:hypothetical protein
MDRTRNTLSVQLAQHVLSKNGSRNKASVIAATAVPP